MIGIIGAMDVEIDLLLSVMQNTRVTTICGRSFFEGEIEGKQVVLSRSGIGKVAAAVCAQTLIDVFKVDSIINTGIAGGIASELSVGDIVVSESAVQHDFDVTGFGYPKGYMCVGADNTSPTLYIADKTLADTVLAVAKEQVNAISGIIATGDVFVNSPEIKREISETFNAAACEMEGGAIAQVCTLNEVPFVIVRAISDLANGEAAESYEQFERKAAENCAKIVIESVKRI